MNFNFLLWILVVIVIVIIIVYFVFMFKVTKTVINNYNYLKKQYNNLYEIVTDLKKKFDNLNINIPELDDFIKQIQTNINNIKILQNIVDEINVNLKNNDKRISNLEEDNKNIKTNINSINTTLDTHNKEIKEINESISNINKELKKLFDNKDDIDKNLKNLNEYYDSYITDKTKLEENINSRFDTINKEIDELKKQYSENGVNNQDDLQKQINDLKTTTISNTNQLKVLDKSVTDINTKLTNIEISIDTINKNIKSSQDKIESIEGSIKTINENIKELENKTTKEIDSLNNNLKIISQDINTINTNVTVVNNSFDNINKEINTIQKDISSINEKIKELQDHDITKNYIDFINVVSVYQYNKLTDIIYSNPLTSFNSILFKANISFNKKLDILCINDINFDSNLFNNNYNILIFDKSNNEKIFIFSKKKLSNKNVCDMIYINNNEYRYTEYFEDSYGEENNKTFLLNLKYKTNKVDGGGDYKFFYKNYYFIISSEKNLNVNSFKYIYNILKQELRKIESDAIFKSNFIFIFTESNSSNKEIIVNFINEDFDKKLEHNIFMFSEDILNNFLYIGDYKILNDVLLNGIKPSMTSALILHNNFFYITK